MGRPGTERPAAPSAVTNWNLPNALTVLRIALVPLFGWLLLSAGGADDAHRAWACLVFVVGVLTDRVDGDLARRRQLVTRLGTILDPMADKALTGMAFVGLSLIGALWWWVTVLVMVREVGITGLRFWVLRHGVISASRGGKLKTGLQAFALGALILPLRQLPDGLHGLGLVLWWAGVVVMGFAVLVTVVSGVDYVGKALRLRRTSAAESPR